MEKTDRDPFDAARSLTGSLKTKSRRRREDLKLLAASSPRVRATRNDLLPRLDLAYLLLEDLRMPVREVRKLDPAHVREVANSISALGFCAPILVGKDNLVLDGAVRVHAARLLDSAVRRVSGSNISASRRSASCALPSIGLGRRASGASTS
jgi:hypothetical protein